MSNFSEREHRIGPPTALLISLCSHTLYDVPSIFNLVLGANSKSCINVALLPQTAAFTDAIVDGAGYHQAPPAASRIHHQQPPPPQINTRGRADYALTVPLSTRRTIRTNFSLLVVVFPVGRFCGREGAFPKVCGSL